MSEAFPLSPLQRHHLRVREAAPESSWYAAARVRVEGRLEAHELRAALSRLQQRHEILRTHFHPLPGTREWAQSIADHVDPPSIVERDLGELPPHEHEAVLDAVVTELSAPFEPSEASQLRVALVHTASDEHLLYIVQPSVAADRQSVANLVAELAAELADEASNAEPMQFADIAQFLCDALEGEDSVATRKRWSDLGLESAFDQRLALAHDRGPAPFRARSLVRILDPRAADSVRALARARSVSSASIFLGAWQILLARHTDQEEVYTGVSVAGRSFEGLDRALGPFARFLPVRSRPQDAEGFAQLVAELELDLSAAADAHEGFDHDALGLSAEARLPLVFEHRELPGPVETGGRRFVFECCRHRGESFQLGLFVDENRTDVRLCFEYDERFLDDDSVRHLASQYEALLERAVRTPATPPTEVSALTADERRLLLTDFACEDEAPAPSGECVHRWIVERARQDQQALAVVAGETRLTYGELDERSEAVALALQLRGIEPGSFVGLYVARSVEMIVGIVGTLKAGCAYLPLPPDYPRERIELMLADAEVGCVLTRSTEAERLPAFKGEVVKLDELPEVDREVEDRDDPLRPAYAIYTSGSTGKPKGVPISHANLAFSTAARLDYYADPVGAYLLLSSFAFDSSVAGIFWTLTQGGTLVLPPQGFEQDIPALADTISRNGITHLLGLPSLWNAILETSESEKLAALRTVIVAGESCTPELLQRHHSTLPDTKLFNEYGPTEATVWSTVFDGTNPNVRSQVPIGRPIPGAEVYIVDESGAPSPIGLPGELLVGGPGVAAGYRGRPELTAERFVAHPFGGTGHVYKTGDRARFLADGNIEFLGRIDHQVKVRGFRIELEEIESVLTAHAGVREAVVLAESKSGGADVQLAAYVTPTGNAPAEALLREHLAALLPDYMVPARFQVVERLPLLPNGKVDRSALASAEPVGQTAARVAAEAQEFEAPEGAIEQVLALLWSDVLGVERVGREDDFFKLGGHSILATKLFARIVDTLGVKIRLRALFEKRRLRSLAETIVDEAENADKLERRAKIALQVLELSDDETEKALGA